MPTRPEPVITWRDTRKRRQARDHRRERRLARHQIVLVRPVGRALAVHVVLVELQLRGAGHAGDVAGGGLHHPLTGLVPDHRVQRVGALGRGVLRVGVVDVEPGAVGQDHVRRADLVGVDHRRRAGGSAQVEAAGVPQRRLHLVVPPGALCPLDTSGGRVRQHRLRRRQDRIRGRIGRRGNAVLDLGPDNPLHVDQPRGRPAVACDRAIRAARRRTQRPRPPVPGVAERGRDPADVVTGPAAIMIDVTQRRAAELVPRPRSAGGAEAGCPGSAAVAAVGARVGGVRGLHGQLRARRGSSPASTPLTSTASRLERSGSSWGCSSLCCPIAAFGRLAGVAHLDRAQPTASRRRSRWPSRSPAASSAAPARGYWSISSSRPSWSPSSWRSPRAARARSWAGPPDDACRTSPPRVAGRPARCQCCC